MREAGDVSFTDVLHEGDDNVGIVEFFNKDDMTYAVASLKRNIRNLENNDFSE